MTDRNAGFAKRATSCVTSAGELVLEPTVLFNTTFRDSLRFAFATLSILNAAFATGHLFVLTGESQLIMATLAVSTAILFTILFLALGKFELPPRFAHPLAGASAALLLFNSLLHLYLTSAIEQK